MFTRTSATPAHDHGDHHRLRTETAKPILAAIVDLGGRDGGRVLPGLCSLGYDAGGPTTGSPNSSRTRPEIAAPRDSRISIDSSCSVEVTSRRL